MVVLRKANITFGHLEGERDDPKPDEGEPKTENGDRGLREESLEGKTGPKKGPKGTHGNQTVGTRNHGTR